MNFRRGFIVAASWLFPRDDLIFIRLNREDGTAQIETAHHDGVDLDLMLDAAIDCLKQARDDKRR